MSSAQLPPKTNNGVLNTEFNSSDFAVSANDARYLKLTGGTVSGSLAVNSTTTTNGITSLAGINQFNTNISLPTTYSASPNLDLPGSGQLGGYLFAQQTTGVTANTGTVAVIVSLDIPAGVWIINWRGSIYPTAAGTTTYSNIRMSMTTSNGTINPSIDVQQRVSIAASQICTFGATNGYDVSLMGSTIVRPTSTTPTTYYLNAASVFSGIASQWRGHIHAVRIA
jgi:hypothetical protein